MNIYVIGDSISIQYGPYLEKCLGDDINYARKDGDAEARLNLDNPAGANGGDSLMVLTFLDQAFKSGGIDADLLLVNCGLHDIKTNTTSGEKQVSIERYARNLESIVQTVANMKPLLVWITTTPCDERVHNREGMQFHRFAADCDAYNATADTIMKEAGVPSIDLHAFTLELGRDIYCDHVHFHEHIREKQAVFIADWLISFKKKQKCP